MASRKQQLERDDRPKKRSKLKRRHFLGMLALVGLMLFVLFLPRLLTSKPVLATLVDRFAGIAPLRIEVERAEAGWFLPVSVHGVVLRDADDHVLARIGKVTTEKGLIGWATNSQDLGTIEVSELEAAIVAGNGTTNVEQATAHLMEQPEETPSAGSSSSPTGTIRVENAKFLLTQSGRPEQWVVQLASVAATLPRDDQVIGPIAVEVKIGEVSGAVQNSVGTFTAEVAQVDSAFEIRAQLNNVPIDLWHVIHARFPEIPVDELQGRVSGSLSGKILDAESWSFDLQQVESRSFAIAAPSIVGNDPARLDSILATGRAALVDGMMTIDNAQLACDFGAVQAAAQIPWPIIAPTAANPFVQGAAISASGSLDLPKLVRAANSLLPMRPGTQLTAGTAQFSLSQTVAPQGNPASRANLTFAGLQANAGGQQLNWNDPLSVELFVEQLPEGLHFGTNAQAEFCDVRGGGTLEAGNLNGSIDLDRLQKRLSEWVELPIRTMNGSAKLGLNWTTGQDGILAAQGSLNTSPLRIASTYGTEVQEPAWTGVLEASARMEQGVPSRIERARLKLTAEGENLTVDLQEPMALSAAGEIGGNTQPSAFAFTLMGDLAGWKRRGLMWLAEPPELELTGNVNLALGGRVDRKHIEVHQANWNIKPIQVGLPGMRLSEAEMVGKFAGRVDSGDLTRLQVDSLQVQASSFSIGAKDEAAPDGSGRIGQAMFLVDLNQLLKSMDSSNEMRIAPIGGEAPSATQYSASGRIQGQLGWQVTSQAAGVSMAATGDMIALFSMAPGEITPSPLWDEPSVNVKLGGHWTAETNAIDISQMTLETPWCNYSGTIAAETTTTNKSTTTERTMQRVVSKGSAHLDTARLSAKLAPMTGNQLQLAGIQTVPIEVQWTSPADVSASMLAGLDAVTLIGWEQARVAGIELGRADVPVNITKGQLATKAEIPVSGGKLRWDITSDLAAEEIVINQRPMTVLENVEISEAMCKGWLKYVAPLIAEATSVDGRLSLTLSQAKLTPANLSRQSVAGQLVMHQVEVGPGPLSTTIIGLVKQIDSLRKREVTQNVGSQQVWLKMPEQRVDFQMKDGRVSHQNLTFSVGDVTLATSGSVDINGQMDMVTRMPIPDDWIEKSPYLVGLRGQALEFPVRGTLKQPQLDAQSIRQLGRQAVEGAAQGLIEKGLSRGFEKIFGGLPPMNSPPIIPQPQSPPK